MTSEKITYRESTRNWIPMDVPFKNALEKFKDKRRELTDGCVTESDMTWIIQEDRHCKMLIRHTHGRLICAAEEVDFHIKCIESYRSDSISETTSIRDVSFVYKDKK